MSLRWIESVTPFVDEACVTAALEAVGARYRQSQDLLEVSVEPGEVAFRRLQGGWVLRRREDASHGEWEQRFIRAYEEARAHRASCLDAIQRRRLELADEQAQRQLVESRRGAIVERAKALGFAVREDRANGEVRLVLIRRKA